MRWSVLDIFAGAGGFSLGFKQAGAQIVGAIEIDSWACETFKINHPDAIVIQDDIVAVSDETIMGMFGTVKPNVLIGGPPCQGFSISNNHRENRDDVRNSLFKELIRIARVLTPEVLIIENVPNLRSMKNADNELIIDVIQNGLKEIGYHVQHHILEATDYGVPQMRKRLFIVATLKELSKPFPEKTHTINISSGLFESPLKTCPTLWDAISDLPEIEAREGAEEMEYPQKPVTGYQKLLRGEADHVFNHKAMNHSKRLVTRFKSMNWGDSTVNVPEHLKPLKRNGKEFSEKIYEQNNRRMHPNRPCHTITASFYANFVHPYKDRNFTAREGARIQSFPDSYVFKGKPTIVSRKLLEREGRVEEKHLCQYNQIGNAVPPLVAKAIADNIFKQF